LEAKYARLLETPSAKGKVREDWQQAVNAANRWREGFGIHLPKWLRNIANYENETSSTIKDCKISMRQQSWVAAANLDVSYLWAKATVR